MDEKTEILRENISQYLQDAAWAFKNKRYNTAVVLFYKAIDALVDLFLYKTDGISTSSHANRFHVTREKHPPIYKILDRDFPYYQKSYTNRMSKEEGEMMAKDANEIKKLCQE